MADEQNDNSGWLVFALCAAVVLWVLVSNYKPTRESRPTVEEKINQFDNVQKWRREKN